MSLNKVLITGGLGFIGLNLAKELLSQGRRVTLLDNLSPQVHGVFPRIDSEVIESSNVRVIRGDITVPSVLKNAIRDIDAIIHLAAETGTAQSMYQIAHYNMVNVQATALLMDILTHESHKVQKIILSSSRSVYGEGAYTCRNHGVVSPNSRSAEDLKAHKWAPGCPICGKAISLIPTPETLVPNPASIYAATKLAQEHLIRIAADSLEISTTILRLQNVYGAGQSLNNPYTGILSIFSTRIRRGMTLPIYEDGLESRDFVHVQDVVQAFKLALDSTSVNGKTFNVGTGKATTIKDMANILVDLLGGKVKPTVTGEVRLGDIRHCYADLKSISRELGYNPQVTIKQGLREFADWVLTQPLPEDGLDKANRELRKHRILT